MLAIVATLAVIVPVYPAEAATVFTVYMSATGSDTRDGLTPATAVRSLIRVQQVLVEHGPATDVEVRVAQGTYVAPPFHTWRFYVPGHTVSFLPIDYEYGEGISGIAGRPVFRNARTTTGTYPSGFWLQPRLPTDPTHPLYGGGTSGLRFYYLQVELYSAGGVSIFGDSERDVADERYTPPLRRQGSAGLNGNTFVGMRFANLGNKWATGAAFGYGAIVLTNSSGNRVDNSHFSYVENLNPAENLIHGLYITHFSSDNTVSRNLFTYVSGDPIKVRDRSNVNTIEANTFTRAGRLSFYRDEFCDTQCARDNDIERQCASYHNRFFDNKLVSDYDGDNSSGTWTLSPPGLTYAGAAPCAIPAGDVRLRTGGNTA